MRVVTRVSCFAVWVHGDRQHSNIFLGKHLYNKAGQFTDISDSENPNPIRAEPYGRHSFPSPYVPLRDGLRFSITYKFKESMNSIWLKGILTNRLPLTEHAPFAIAHHVYAVLQHLPSC